MSRAAAFAAWRPALDALVSEAGADPRLSTEARRVLRTVTRTRPQDSVAPASLAARSSTPKSRIPATLTELQTHGYLTRLTSSAPHLAAALPFPAPPPPTRIAS